VVLVQQVCVGREPFQVRLDQPQGEPLIGDDVVEVAEEIILGHRRQITQL
jgi:hypothetical protein